jgi:hypothetical protein
MPFWRHIKSGLIFSPEDLVEMSQAYESAIAELGVPPEVKMRRETIAQFIIDLARVDGRIQAAVLLRGTLKALGGFRARPDYP